MKEKSFVELVCARFDDDGVQVTSAIGMDGKEYPDPVPMAPPVGYTPPPDILTMIRQVVRNEQVLRLQDEAGFDTFDEAEDFEVEDSDFDPHTPYEAVFDPPPVPEGSGANGGPPASQQPAAPVEVSKPVVSDDRKIEGSEHSGNKDSKLGSSLGRSQSGSQSEA